jgi:hypothetical protein
MMVIKSASHTQTLRGSSQHWQQQQHQQAAAASSSSPTFAYLITRFTALRVLPQPPFGPSHLSNPFSLTSRTYENLQFFQHFFPFSIFVVIFYFANFQTFSSAKDAIAVTDL